jgi:hypothetical protein
MNRAPLKAITMISVAPVPASIGSTEMGLLFQAVSTHDAPILSPTALI